MNSRIRLIYRSILHPNYRYSISYFKGLMEFRLYSKYYPSLQYYIKASDIMEEK